MGSHPVLGTNRPILLFDTSCLLCNRSVQFLLKADKRKHIIFAGLSSTLGKELLSNNKIQEDSVVLYYFDKCYVKSSAILRVSKILGFPYSIFQIFYIFPLFIRNWVYDVIASNRKQWFGVTEQCLINNEKYSDRIIL